jgi:TusA-related sulfurtransferase
MAATTDWAAELAATAAPTDRPRELLDVRELGPPDPLVETLETLPELPAETLLVQVNDRVPHHLYPKLDDRGYRYATVEREDAVVTGIWRA